MKLYVMEEPFVLAHVNTALGFFTDDFPWFYCQPCWPIYGVSSHAQQRIPFTTDPLSLVEILLKL